MSVAIASSGWFSFADKVLGSKSAKGINTASEVYKYVTENDPLESFSFSGFKSLVSGAAFGNDNSLMGNLGKLFHEYIIDKGVKRLPFLSTGFAVKDIFDGGLKLIQGEWGDAAIEFFSALKRLTPAGIVADILLPVSKIATWKHQFQQAFVNLAKGSNEIWNRTKTCFKNIPDTVAKISGLIPEAESKMGNKAVTLIAKFVDKTHKAFHSAKKLVENTPDTFGARALATG